MATPHLPTTLLNTITSHTAPINAVTFSSLGGTFILTGSSDRQIHLTRTEPTSDKPSIISNGPIQKYAAHGYPVLDIAVSRDNQTFASVGGDRSVFLWEVQNATSTSRRFGASSNQGHTSRITCVSFAGEGDGVLVSGSDDRSVRLWDVKSRDGRPLMVWDEARDGVSCLSVLDNGHEIVTGSVDGRVRSYDLRVGRCTVDVLPGALGSLQVSRDEKSMLVSCLDGKIRLMDRTNGACLRAFPQPGHDAGFKNDAFRLKSALGAHEALVLSGSEADGHVKVWDVLSGKLVRDLDVSEANKVVSVVKWREASTAQGRQAVWAAGGADGMVKIYG